MADAAWIVVDRYVEKFEQARRLGNAADLGTFLPGRDEPLFVPVLRELVRTELEFAWERGQPGRLEDYRAAFPELFGDPEVLESLAFEEYRQRARAGEAVSASEYRARYGVSARWPSLRPSVAPSTRPEGIGSLLPIGTDGEFEGFKPLGELGRGAFGRVVLARQRELADRLVVLKLTRNETGEAGILARLTHSQIVPIYARRCIGDVGLICMPYFGATTLLDLIGATWGAGKPPRSGAEVVALLERRRDELGARIPAAAPDLATRSRMLLDRLAAMPFADVALWLVERLADGLAFAHERGVLHRDIKPANILLSDDGQPMLLDFNLAAPADGRDRPGGTPDSMAPEHLRALVDPGPAPSVDARSDLYAIGLILVQLLTGRLPFPGPGPGCGGNGREALVQMAAERSAPWPPADWKRGGIAAGTRAIIARCLDPDPSRRYADARQLQEDLRRQRVNLPLRFAAEGPLGPRLAKWIRRHPRLISAASVIPLALAAAVVAGMAWSPFLVAPIREPFAPEGRAARQQVVERLDRRVSAHPDDAPALAGRGALHARQGRRDAAHADAHAALSAAFHRGEGMPAAILYQVAGIYAQTSRIVAEDRERAFALLDVARIVGFDPAQTWGVAMADDPDLAPIRDDPRFGRLLPQVID